MLANRALTYVAVLVAWCFFRAANVDAALDILAGMVGVHGLTLAAVDPFGAGMLVLAAGIAFLLPNTNEIILHLETRFANKPTSVSLLPVQWSPSVRWGVATGILLALCILCMDKPQDFIYAQF